ncbi:peptidoglycan editing factor PgeF [Methylobacterium sp. Leaf108]|uniref:peptidoglycan editing factor PgeF n=1 Tax=Methylobacterium sp. Leaf108 TaxID=1736256 RepID=UPI0006FEEAFF|nr:peptidoglycan editing factor PgeF [Methylobacterium sp. Leaf108]KQP50417.1 polyphenol oxidase [Methylobacterium sp. Leaf108]
MFLTSPDLADPAIRHAFFTRRGGVSEGLYASLNGGLGSSDHAGRVAENRRRMCAALGVAETALASLYQIHSAEVVVLTQAPALAERPKADAMVSVVPGLALGIATADCGPILFADTRNGVVGAAHAGWKGALGGVVAATVAAMEALGAERGSIVAVLGPTIHQPSYEVGTDLRDRFEDAVPGAARFFAPGDRPGHAQFDLPGFVLWRLEQEEIGRHASLGLCTYVDAERFYSYRRTTHRQEADYGRLISAIALAP